MKIETKNAPWGSAKSCCSAQNVILLLGSVAMCFNDVSNGRCSNGNP